MTTVSIYYYSLGWFTGLGLSVKIGQGVNNWNVNKNATHCCVWTIAANASGAGYFIWCQNWCTGSNCWGREHEIKHAKYESFWCESLGFLLQKNICFQCNTYILPLFGEWYFAPVCEAPDTAVWSFIANQKLLAPTTMIRGICTHAWLKFLCEGFS